MSKSKIISIIQKILMFIGGLTVLAVLVFGGMMLFSGGGMQALGKETDSAYTELLLGPLREWDTSMATPHLSDAMLQAADGYTINSKFSSIKGEFGEVVEVREKMGGTWRASAIDGAIYANLTFKVNFEKRDGTVTMNAEKHDGVWKINSILVSKHISLP